MDVKRVFRWWLVLVAAAVLAVACDLTGGGETPPAVEPATAEAAVETAEAQPPAGLPATMEPEAATAVPADTATTARTPAATATLPGIFDPANQPPTPVTDVQTAEPTTATIEPVIAPPGTLAPGQQTGGTIEPGGAQIYTFQGNKFEPVLIFVEGADTLDIALDAYQGAAVVYLNDPGAQEPIATADFSPAGIPEIMIITPNEDGEHILIVQDTGGTTGNFTLYMFDGTTPAANTRIESDTLAAGETKNYKAVSNGGRPVIVYVDQTGQSDLILHILDDEEELITEANFGGPNSAETAFVLPLEETAYTILVSTVNGETAAYNLVIVTLN